MRHATLIVQDFSFDFVASFVHYLHNFLRRHADPEASLIRCAEIDDAQHPAGLVFLIGENFKPFRRRRGCTYFYINLSVVAPLGSLFAASLRGHRQVFRKHRLLTAKLPHCDALLDFYPPQTQRLKRKLDLPVFDFDYAVEPHAGKHNTAVDHDVCFVGGLTPRRERILSALRAKGIRMSPHAGAPIEALAAASRCCLNIHMERSNHLEIPRLVAALSSGCPVISEKSFGLAEFVDGEFVIERPLSRLVSAVEELLADPPRMAALGAEAAAWYSDSYLPRANRRWAEICEVAKNLGAAAA